MSRGTLKCERMVVDGSVKENVSLSRKTGPKFAHSNGFLRSFLRHEAVAPDGDMDVERCRGPALRPHQIVEHGVDNRPLVRAGCKFH